jgi:hypothetical protein
VTWFMKGTWDTSVPVFAPERTPRSFSEAELAPVFELNALFLDSLVEAAHRPSSTSICAWAQALPPQLRQLTAASRVRIAHGPICLIDAGFQQEARWEGKPRCPDVPHAGATVGAPEEEVLELAEKTVTLAWAVARANLEAACIIFGMTTRCARVVSELGIHRLTSLAALNAHQIRPVWADDPQIWGRLLNPAEPPPPSRLPPPHARAMLRQLAEIWLATPVSESSHPLRP